MSSSTTSTPIDRASSDAAVGRARVDVDRRDPRPDEREQAAPQPLPLVPADRDDAEVAHDRSPGSAAG